LNFWAVDDAIKLAKGLQAALDKTARVKKLIAGANARGLENLSHWEVEELRQGPSTHGQDRCEENS
jgi:hypothetical protein